MSEVSAASRQAAPLGASELQTWLSQSPDLLAVTDVHGRVEWANTRFDHAVGPVAGATLESMLFADDRASDNARETVRQALAVGSPSSFRLVLRRRDGESLALQAQVAVAGDRRLWTLQDLSVAEALFARAEHQADVLETMQESGRLGFWRRDIATGKGRWDRHIFNIWGLPPQASAPDYATALASVHPDDRAAATSPDAYDQPGHHAIRYRVVRPDGTTRWLHSQWNVKTSADGRPSELVGVMVDDTDAFALADSVDETALQLELAIGLGQIAIWRHDLHTGRFHSSASGHPVFGISTPVEGLPIEEMRARVHPEDLPRVVAAARQASGAVGPTDLEARYRGPDGAWRHLLTRQVVERNRAGEPQALLGIALDITDLVARARRAEALSHRLETAARAAGLGIWTATIAGEVIEWNAQMHELFGQVGARPPPQLDEWLALCVHADDRLRVRNAALAVFRDEVPSFRIEFRSPRSDGDTRWIEVRGDLDRGPTEHPRVVGIALDVTDRHAALDALREANARTAFITSHAGVGTWYADAGGEQRWDEQMFRLRGLDPMGPVPSYEQRVAALRPEDRVQIGAAMALEQADGMACAYEFRVEAPDGLQRWLAARSAPVRDDSGRITGRVGVHWDITESKHAALARQQQSIAERESEAKSRFTSRMSHELRTPLNAVLGFTQLMQIEAEEAGRSTDLGKLKHIRLAGEQLLAMINDVLDLTDLESGKLHLEPQAVALVDAVSEALQRVEPLARQRQVRIAVRRLDGRAHVDPARLRQILHQLLSRIIKGTRPGSDLGVESRVHGKTIRLRLRDSGSEPAPDQLGRLFEAFNRPDGDRGDSPGAGLAVVKALVERMGGGISASNQPGLGTVFELTLPTYNGAPSSRAASNATRSGSLLYIEDNSVNVLLVEEMVASLPGLRVASELTGSAGVARARGTRPDLILIDMQLPDFDGFEVLKRLRAEPETAGITCIALSANAMPEYIARALDAGFADYWTKPIEFRGFVLALERLFPLRNLPG